MHFHMFAPHTFIKVFMLCHAFFFNYYDDSFTLFFSLSICCSSPLILSHSIYTQMHTHVHTHTHPHPHAHAYTRTRTHTRAHARTHARTNARTHTMVAHRFYEFVLNNLLIFTCPAQIPHNPMTNKMLNTADPTMVPTPTSPLAMKTPGRSNQN